MDEKGKKQWPTESYLRGLSGCPWKVLTNSHFPKEVTGVAKQTIEWRWECSQLRRPGEESYLIHFRLFESVALQTALKKTLGRLGALMPYKDKAGISGQHCLQEYHNTCHLSDGKKPQVTNLVRF